MQTPHPAATARPAALACIECRRKHLKCDARSPICSRCATHSLPCSYTPSRRGHARRTKAGSRIDSHAGLARSDVDVTESVVVGTHSREGASPGPAAAWHSRSSAVRDLASPSVSLQPDLALWNRDHLRKLYFTHFHPAHPLLVPITFYSTQSYPEYLDLVVCFIAQHYTSHYPRSGFVDDAISNALAEPADKSSLHGVQALVLYAIALHSLHYPDKAQACIARAVRIALDIGLNQPDFVNAHGSSSWVTQESMRRTWWELNTLDIYLAALHRLPSFASDVAKIHPLLPSTDQDYEKAVGNPTASTLEDFEDRAFSRESWSDAFSPYCYRVEASRLLGRVIRISGNSNATPDQIQGIDNAIAGWKYYLPDQQSDVAQPSGEVNQLFFQAHLFVHCASIFLHFPRSDLPMTVPTSADIACASNHTQPLLPTSSQHAVKAIAASKEIASMAAISHPDTQHSPLFICGLILGAIVQLAAATVHRQVWDYDCLQQHRDRVLLLMGVLKSFGQRWTVARNAHNQLRVVANMVFAVNGRDASNTLPSSSAISVHDSGIGHHDAANSVSWFDLFAPEEVEGELLSFDAHDSGL